MPRNFKTHNAETDLENIWLYSFEEWNEGQADRYYDQLIKGMNKLLDNPELGKSLENVRRGYRSMQINSHIVYYRIQGSNIRIIRILHERMLPEIHL